MAVIRISRFRSDPAQVEEMLVRRNTLVAAVRASCGGPRTATLARVDDETWMDVWHWDSVATLTAALEKAPTMPEAQAAFALTSDVTGEHGEIVDER